MRGLSAIDTSTGAMDRLIDAMVDAARLRAGHELNCNGNRRIWSPS